MATVYDKSSLFLAPSGVSNGTVFVQKPVPIYGSEQVTNGDFSQTGAEEVRNGDFSDGTYWSTPTGWSINNGTLQGTNVNAISATQSGFSFLNKSFRVEYTITEISQGDIKVYLGGSQSTPQRSAVGTYVEYIDITSANATLYIQGINNFTGKIDNVSVKELGQDWNLGTGWSIGEDKAISNGNNLDAYLSQAAIVAGKTYKVTFDVNDYTSGALSVRPANESQVLSVTAIGSYVAYVTSISSISIGFRSAGVAGFDGSVTNISVQEVLSPDGDFTFTRGSNLSATRVNEAQLIEKGRENLLLQSNQFDTTWGNAGTTEIGGQADKDGGTSAWLLRRNVTNSYLVQTISQSNLQTFSIYAKAGSLSWFRILNTSSVGDKMQFFDLQNGALGAKGGLIDSSIESVGNGWYRCSITYNATTTGVRIYPADGDNDTTGSSGDIYIQDAQLEQGLVATSVITTGAVPAQAGLLENTPRLDYSDGATCPSLLLEPSRSNLVVTSEYAGGSGWFISSGYSVSQNVAISPEGVQNAFELTIPSINGNTRAIVSVSPSTEYTFSFYVKRGTATELKYSIFNLTNNTNIIAQTSYYSQTSATEWKRIEVTFTTPAGCTSAGVYIDRDSQADGTAFFYGLQCEAGSYATSYIPTYGSSVTRVGETCIKTSYPDLSSQQELTLYTEFNYEQSGRVIAIGNGTTSTRFFASYGSAKQMYMYLNIGGTLAFFLTSPNDTLLDGKNKVAVKIKSGESLLYLNGTEIFNNTSTFTLSGFQNVYIGTSEYGSTNDIQKIDSALIFYTALTDLQLAILTGATTYETFDEMALALNYTVYE